jgi:hypothetical protein
MFLTDLRLTGHATGSTLRCAACGASLETGRRQILASELGALSRQLVHRTGCTRTVRADDEEAPTVDTNSLVRNYGESSDYEVVGVCHPEAGVAVRISNGDELPKPDVTIECRACHAPVATLGYRVEPLGTDVPPEWVCPCGKGQLINGDPSDPSVSQSQCRACKRPIQEFIRMRFRLTVCGYPTPVAPPNEPAVAEPRWPVQAEHQFDPTTKDKKRSKKPAGAVGDLEARIPYDAYVSRYGSEQTFERLHERGGFGYWELTYFLGQEPKTWKERE